RTFQWYGATPDRRSLPTRRSSDLTPRRRRSTNSASTGIASQTDCAPALEQPPEGMPAAGVCAATPGSVPHAVVVQVGWTVAVSLDRKSTRLNSSHQIISYAVFCLK